MEVLALHTGAPTVHWKDNNICVYVVESKIVTLVVKQIDIPASFYYKFLTMLILLPNIRSIYIFKILSMNQTMFRSNYWLD